MTDAPTRGPVAIAAAAALMLVASLIPVAVVASVGGASFALGGVGADHGLREPPSSLRDEMAIIYKECENPVVVIDDFDAGNGLDYDQYPPLKLDMDYIATNVPPDYKFCLNPWSNRNRGVIFIFPGSAPYGCKFADRGNYSEEKHGLWGKRLK